MSDLLTVDKTFEPSRLRFDELRAEEEALIDEILTSQALLYPGSIRKDDYGLSTVLKLEDSVKEPEIEGSEWELEVKHNQVETDSGRKQVIFRQSLNHEGKKLSVSSMAYGFFEVEEPLTRRGTNLEGQKVRGSADFHEERELFLELYKIAEFLQKRVQNRKSSVRQMGALSLTEQAA